MTQLAGWRFLELGRRIERAIADLPAGALVRRPGAADGGLDVLLELADSQITYRQRYVMVAARAPVIDLVMLDPNNPRSVVFQLDRIEAHLAALPRRSATAGCRRCSRSPPRSRPAAHRGRRQRSTRR